MAVRVFLLSPARCDGLRAEMLFDERARFGLARALRTPEGAPLGDVFAFMSGLYFRGKLKYAMEFGTRLGEAVAAFVITPDRGLVPPWTRVTRDDMLAMASVPIDLAEPRYREPLERDAARLAEALPPDAQVVLLGSIATGKYVDPLLSTLGSRLVFPEAFVGRGDMSRGGLLLRCVRAGEPLAYVPVAGAVRRGARPARLERGAPRKPAA